MKKTTIQTSNLCIKYKTTKFALGNKLKLVLEPINKSESMDLLLKLAIMLSNNRKHSGLKLYKNRNIELIFNLENYEDINQLISLSEKDNPILSA